MHKFTLLTLIAMVALLGTVVVQAQYYQNYIGTDGYSGYDARERRLTDPYNRDRYFGLASDQNFVSFGSKGPTSGILSTGAKSAYSGVFNLDTNTYRPQGRNPGRISNFDPGIRGYASQDAVAYLEPFSPVTANGQAISGKGTARIVQTGEEHGNRNDYSDFQTQVSLSVINLPPLEKDFVYEVWMVDEDTEYPLNIGILNTKSIKYTAQLQFSIRRSLLPFEAIMITREPFLDNDPTPGEVILYGRVAESRDALPIPTQYISQRVR